MKILILKQLFYPEPTARSIDFALELKKLGHQVQVLTSFPSYPQGKIYDGYKQKIFHKEMIQGIEVIRVPIFPDQSGRAIFRILNYLSYAFSATILGLPRVSKPDIVFAYHGALPVGIPAMVNKLFRGTPFVYDINDLWPDTLTATNMLKNKLIISFVNKWCNFTYNRANAITVLSEGFKKKLIERNVPSNKLNIIHHWSRDKISTEKLPKQKREKLFPESKINILYAGNLGAAQSLTSLLKVAQRLQSSANVKFIFVGSGVEEKGLINYANGHNLLNVEFHPRVDSSEVSKFLNSADILVVHLKDDPLFRITLPSKILAYLKTGKPILMGIKGDAEEIIVKSNAGLCCIPDDIDDIENKILEFCKMSAAERQILGENASRYYQESFTIEKNVKKYHELFEDIIKQ